MVAVWVRDVSGGAELAILVQPRASRTRIVGVHDQLLKVQLAAPPVDGEANDALIRFLADRLGCGRGALSLVAGETSRRKRVRVLGMTAAGVEAVMNAPA